MIAAAAAFLADPVHRAIAIIYGLLVFSSAVTLILRRVAPGEMSKELTKRVVSWWWMITVFSIAILTTPVVSTVFLGFISYLALKEYFSLIPMRRVDRAVLLLAYLAIPAQYYFAQTGQYGLAIVFIPVWLFLLVPTQITLMGHTEGFLRAVGTISWGVMICVFSLSHTALLLKFGSNHGLGAGALLFLVALTQFNDVAQFTTGKLFGRHKIIPKVSPKKTWEGFLGGLLLSTLAAAAFGPELTPMDWQWSALAGAIIALSGFLGDVTISACKRDLGVKDASQLIPGHGGILDRVDSLIYAAPVFFHFLNFFFGNWPATPL